MRRKEVTQPIPPETLKDVHEQWKAGLSPDFSIRENTRFEEGARVVVIDGEHAGRFGRVVLTHDSDHHALVARLLALSPHQVRVVLDRTELGAWSGVLPVASLKPTRMESDAELYARIAEAHGKWGAFLSVAMESGGKALDDCARHLGIERREMAFLGASKGGGGLPEK